MRRRPLSPRRVVESLLAVVLVVMAPGACSSGAANGSDPGTLDQGGRGGLAPVPGSGGASASDAGAGDAPLGGRSSGNHPPGSPGGGDTGPSGDSGTGDGEVGSDRCKADSDCGQAPGSCFACRQSGAAKDCIDLGPPTCDDGKLEPCEVCELGDTMDCALLGEPGEYSGGRARCRVGCDGWDTSACSVCGNGQLEPGEQCEVESGAAGASGMGGAAGFEPHTCADEGIAQNAGKILPCTEACRWDATLCAGCDPEAARCLDGSNCAGSACAGAECKVGTQCEFDCSGQTASCQNGRCNHLATCDVACARGSSCDGFLCDSHASCTFDCTGAGASCGRALCRAGATCRIDCRDSASCEDLRCEPGSACSVTCNGAHTNCSGKITCSAGENCHFDCGSSGSCAELQVVCEAESSCAFDCRGAGSICPRASCQAGSSCTFDCAGGDCNHPACARGACTGN